MEMFWEEGCISERAAVATAGLSSAGQGIITVSDFLRLSSEAFQ